MKYEDFEKILSPVRLSRYLHACGDDKNKALKLYRLNIKLSQEFYALLSLFEVTLRNAVNEHYITHFKDCEWLKNQCLRKGFLNNHLFKSGHYKSKLKIDNAIRELGINYNNDRLVASLSFGFWVNLFAPIQFRLTGQNLHKIFTKRPNGSQPKLIYKDLNLILTFRNRVAHHEPICFNGLKVIDISGATICYNLICKYINWLDLDKAIFLNDLDDTTFIINEIYDLKKDLC